MGPLQTIARIADALRPVRLTAPERPAEGIAAALDAEPRLR